MELCVELEVIFEFGIGSISSHAANTFAAQLLQGGFGLESDELLEYFSKIDVDSQGVNALSNLILSKIKQERFSEADKLLKVALEKCKAAGPNLNTLSYFTAWDGSNEEPIFIEIFESALLVKAQLGKKAGLREVANQVVEYCGKRSIEPDVLATAQQYL